MSPIFDFQSADGKLLCPDEGPPPDRHSTGWGRAFILFGDAGLPPYSSA